MAWRPHGYLRVDPKNPACAAACDRCGFVYNLKDLVWQYDWRGSELTNIKIRVCTRTCLDLPYEGRRPLKLPPDPVPVREARPIQAIVEMNETESLNGNASELLFGDG